MFFIIFLAFVLLFGLFYLYISGFFITKIKTKIKKLDNIKTISLGGAGWKLYYQIGVLKALEELLGHKKLLNMNYAGISAGSLISTSILCGMSIDKIYDDWKMMALKQSKKNGFLNKLSTKDMFEDYFDNIIEPKINSKHFTQLKYFMTKLDLWPLTIKIDFKSNFKDLKHLKRSLFRSGHIPFIGDKSLYCYDKMYLDGGLLCDQPFFDNDIDSTLCISLSNINADIKPSVHLPLKWMFMINEKRIDLMYKLGYEDTLRYFNL